MAEGDGATADWHSQNTLLAVRTRIDGILDLLGALALTEPEENRERLQSLKLASDYCEQAREFTSVSRPAPRYEAGEAALVADVAGFELAVRLLGSDFASEFEQLWASIEGVVRTHQVLHTVSYGGTGLAADTPRVVATGSIGALLTFGAALVSATAASGLPIRAGVAFGSVAVIATAAGPRLLGSAVELAGRVCSGAAAGAVLCDESVGEAHVVGWEFSSHPPLTIAGHEMRPVLCYRPGTDVPPVAPRAMVPPNKLLAVYQQQVAQLQTAVAHAGTELSLVRAELISAGRDPDSTPDPVADLKQQLGQTQAELQQARLLVAASAHHDQTGLAQALLAQNAMLVSKAVTQGIGNPADSAELSISAPVGTEPPSDDLIADLTTDVKHLQLDLEYHQQKLDSAVEERDELQHLTTALRAEVQAARQAQELAEQQLRHQAIDLDAPPRGQQAHGPTHATEEENREAVKALRQEVQTKDSALLFCHFELHKEKQIREKFEGKNKKLSDRMEKLMVILEAQRAQMQKLENGLLLSEETLDAKTKLLRDVQAESRRLREAVRLPSVPASPTAGRGSVGSARRPPGGATPRGNAHSTSSGPASKGGDRTPRSKAGAPRGAGTGGTHGSTSQMASFDPMNSSLMEK